MKDHGEREREGEREKKTTKKKRALIPAHDLV